MEIDIIERLISSVGFPIFVAVYLLVFNRKTVKALTQAIDKLTIMVERLCNERGGK